MAEKEIIMLREQVQKLEAHEFDLESWKIVTINMLEHIFGSSSVKIEQVKDLKYDFSSWSLRDTSGSTGSIKKKAKVILESAINELESYGLPNQDPIEKGADPDIIMNVFEDELTGAQLKGLKEILIIQDLKMKKEQLKEFLDSMNDEVNKRILLNIALKI